MLTSLALVPLSKRMLEDTSFAHVVSWGPQGDCFVVKDMNEFTKSILPRMFKHSNFASFVRQLNKYDFHKVCIQPSYPCSRVGVVSQQRVALAVSVRIAALEFACLKLPGTVASV